MENIQIYVDQLEELIVESLDGGLTFKASKLESEWENLHPEVPFKSVITELVAQNKVDAQTQSYYRFKWHFRVKILPFTFQLTGFEC
jgi:hypothetical protein